MQRFICGDFYTSRRSISLIHPLLNFSCHDRVVEIILFKQFNIFILIKRDGGIGPMMSQQPACIGRGANSNRYFTYLEDKKIDFNSFEDPLLIEGPLF